MRFGALALVQIISMSVGVAAAIITAWYGAGYWSLVVMQLRPGTVKTHTRNIYRKVRVKSKIGMLLRFVTDARELSS